MIPVDHQTIALVFANGLGFLLKENEGIIAQAETANKDMHKFIVWKQEGKIHVSIGDDIDKEVGTRFHIWDTVGDTILHAALDGEEFIL